MTGANYSASLGGRLLHLGCTCSPPCRACLQVRKLLDGFKAPLPERDTRPLPRLRPNGAARGAISSVGSGDQVYYSTLEDPVGLFVSAQDTHEPPPCA